MQVTRVEMELGGRTLSIETGKMAKQADGAVIVQYGETVILGTAVHAAPRAGIDFFPLTVDYREKTSAVGKFPGGFRKREGAPNQKEILTMRNIDRPIRPLFPKGYFDEVQIQCWVLAADGQNEPDVLAGIAASAALSISSIPFEGPVGNVRVGLVDGQFVVMPTAAQAEFSELDMLLCGHKDGLNMIEVGANELSEQQVADAIRFGYEPVKQMVDMIDDLVAKTGKEKVCDLILPSDEIVQTVNTKLSEPLRAAKTDEGTKLQRQEAVKKSIKDFIASEFPEPGEEATFVQVNAWQEDVKQAKMAVHDLEETITREVILTGKRTDGRAVDEIRPIECEVGVLPRV
ncbi:MAG: polyribonucleotide nucleotidyltransferase, partial [Phycisphaerae bacterium]|nr:polyribonucleotide nucleotidyltransferase [Phycisphaerae bacterium]